MVIKGLIFPASILAGTIIGAGVFSLPFVFQSGGLWTGIFYLGLAVLIFILEYFFYADIILNTPGDHRLLGYAKLYLGSVGFWVSILAGLLPMIFSLTIYLVLAPSFFRLIFGGGQLIYLIIFWLIGSYFTLLNTKRIAAAEVLITAALIVIMGAIFFLGIDDFLIRGNDWLALDVSNLLALGPVFFALAGSAAVPELVSYFRETKTPINFLKPAIVLGVVLPAVAYFLFSLGVIGLSPQVSEDAVSGLVGAVPGPILIVIGFLGFLAIISSYIVIGLDARRTLNYDLGIPKWLSRALIVFGPIALYFLGFQDFLQLVSVFGKVFLPIEILLIVFIWLKLRYTKRNNY